MILFGQPQISPFEYRSLAGRQAIDLCAGKLDRLFGVVVARYAFDRFGERLIQSARFHRALKNVRHAELHQIDRKFRRVAIDDRDRHDRRLTKRDQLEQQLRVGRWPLHVDHQDGGALVIGTRCKRQQVGRYRSNITRNNGDIISGDIDRRRFGMSCSVGRNNVRSNVGVAIPAQIACQVGKVRRAQRRCPIDDIPVSEQSYIARS